MSDGTEFYIRLQLLLIESCKVLRNVFVHNAKADTSTGVPYTTLDTYLQNYETDIQTLVKRKVLHKKQYDVLFNSGKPANEQVMDITLVSCLLLNIQSLLTQEKQWVTDIREVRNKLNHCDDITAIHATDFNTFWNDVETASIELASTIDPTWGTAVGTSINELKGKPLPPQGPYVDIIKDITTQNRDIQYLKDAADTTNSYMKNLVEVSQKPNEPARKRIMTYHPNLARMRDSFKNIMRMIPERFAAPDEITSMEDKLRNFRRLYVIGETSNTYLKAALFAVKTLGVEMSRCMEMKDCSDWKDINRDDVDLVLFRNPFGSKRNVSDIIGKVLKCFDSINEELNGEELQSRMYIIVTEDKDVHLEYMDKCSSEPHAILSEIVEVKNPTIGSAEDPHILTDKTPANVMKSDESILKNLQEQTQVYMDQFKTEHVPIQRYTEARDILRRVKYLRIDGPRRSGRTSLAVKLMSKYTPEQCLLLQHPPDMRYIRLGDLSMILIEDVVGKYAPDKQLALQWYRVFDVLLAAVLSGKLSVIVTTETSRLTECNLPQHDLFQHCVTLVAIPSPIIKQESGQPGTSASLTTEMYPSGDRKSLLDASFEEQDTAEISTRWIGGCTFMPSGHLVLACYYGGVVLMDTGMTNKLSTLDIQALSISTVSNNDVITTTRRDQYLQYISVSPPDMDFGERVDVGDGVVCKDVDVSNNNIYVLCEYKGEYEVRILNRQGLLLNIFKLPISYWSYYNFKVNRNGDKVFISSGYSDKVTCIHATQGNVIYEYSDTDLRSPRDMYVDDEDTLLVCGADSNNVHVIDSTGRQRNVLMMGDGKRYPTCVSYRETDNCLVVGCAYGKLKLVKFKVR